MEKIIYTKEWSAQLQHIYPNKIYDRKKPITWDEMNKIMEYHYQFKDRNDFIEKTFKVESKLETVAFLKRLITPSYNKNKNIQLLSFGSCFCSVEKTIADCFPEAHITVTDSVEFPMKCVKQYYSELSAKVFCIGKDNVLSLTKKPFQFEYAFGINSFNCINLNTYRNFIKDLIINKTCKVLIDFNSNILSLDEEQYFYHKFQNYAGFKNIHPALWSFTSNTEKTKRPILKNDIFPHAYLRSINTYWTIFDGIPLKMYYHLLDEYHLIIIADLNSVEIVKNENFLKGDN